MNNTVRNLDSDKWNDNSHPIVQTTHSAFLGLSDISQTGLEPNNNQ